MDIFKLDPVCKEYGWGGYHLSQSYGKAPSDTRVAECWEMSCHLDGLSSIADPRFGGRTLLSYLYENGDLSLGENCSRFSRFPLEVRLVDTGATPSIHLSTCTQVYGKTSSVRIPGNRRRFCILSTVPRTPASISASTAR